MKIAFFLPNFFRNDINFNYFRVFVCGFFAFVYENKTAKFWNYIILYNFGAKYTADWSVISSFFFLFVLFCCPFVFFFFFNRIVFFRSAKLQSLIFISSFFLFVFDYSSFFVSFFRFDYLFILPFCISFVEIRKIYRTKW